MNYCSEATGLKQRTFESNRVFVHSLISSWRCMRPLLRSRNRVWASLYSVMTSTNFRDSTECYYHGNTKLIHNAHFFCSKRGTETTTVAPALQLDPNGWQPAPDGVRPGTSRASPGLTLTTPPGSQMGHLPLSGRGLAPTQPGRSEQPGPRCGHHRPLTPQARRVQEIRTTRAHSVESFLHNKEVS